MRRRGLTRQELLQRGGAAFGGLSLAGLLAACGDGGGEEAAPTEPAPPETGTAEPAPAEAPPAEAGPKVGGTILVSHAGTPPGYDGQKWWNEIAEFPIWSMSERLIEVEPYTGELVPRLAEDFPTIENDGTLYTFRLRQGVQFHNGAGEMTAEDVKFSWERVMSPQLAAEAGSVYFSIPFVGITDFRDERAGEVSGIRVVDPYTLEVELEKPDSALLPAFTFVHAGIFSKKVYEALGSDDKWNWAPTATGPYALESVDPNSGARLVRHEGYWQPGKPYADAVEITFNVDPELALLRIQDNQQDMMYEGVPTGSINDIRDDSSLATRFLEQASSGNTWLSLPTQFGPFTDVRVRQAIAMAIDKEKMARVLKGTADPATGGFLGPTTAYYQEGLSWPFDPEGAKQLLAEAGQPNGFEADFLSQNESPWIDMANAIQQDLSQIGIKVNLMPLVYDDFAAKTVEVKDLPMIIWDWGLPYPHASYLFDAAFTTSSLEGGCCNYPRFSDPEIDRLATEAHNVPEEESVGIYKQLETLVVRDRILWVPLTYPKVNQLLSERVRGYEIPKFSGKVKFFHLYWLES